MNQGVSRMPGPFISRLDVSIIANVNRRSFPPCYHSRTRKVTVTGWRKMMAVETRAPTFSMPRSYPQEFQPRWRYCTGSIKILAKVKRLVSSFHCFTFARWTRNTIITYYSGTIIHEYNENTSKISFKKRKIIYNNRWIDLYLLRVPRAIR